MTDIASLKALADGGKTGWPPGMLQDDDRGLSRWLATRIDSRRHAREAAEAIRAARCESRVLDEGRTGG